MKFIHLFLLSNDQEYQSIKNSILLLLIIKHLLQLSDQIKSPTPFTSLIRSDILLVLSGAGESALGHREHRYRGHGGENFRNAEFLG